MCRSRECRISFYHDIVNFAATATEIHQSYGNKSSLQVPIHERQDAPASMLETQKAIRLSSNGRRDSNYCQAPPNTIFQAFIYASIMHFYKRKDNTQVCDNHKGISLNPVAREILAIFVDSARNEESSTCSCHEQNSYLFSTYVDLTNVFKIIMAKNGCRRICIAL
ncbi:hypothetical protein DPMN_078663 [Dreissena polymorpha]|uniref:Uncharacterized protein n=1 Tax=Dreissena polymorpha TaxID=45954 RepID=A0A9D4BPD0_DREPO|nr:hypothetical protein DPMN_078663 [Dreissena polymorpha]